MSSIYSLDGDFIEKHVYTMGDWANDRIFSAEPGQEIEEDIYYRFFNDLPPVSLPRTAETRGYSAGFLSSEPNGVRNGKMTYAGFGKKEGRYYFIGYVAASDRWVREHS